MGRLLTIASSWALLAAGCQCQPELPADNRGDDRADDNRDTSVPPHTGDTGPPKPCSVPEQEPNNNVGEANVLPTEQLGCGVFAGPVDLDFWEFELTEDAWLGVRVNAASLGSVADVQVVVTSDVGVGATRTDNEDSNDVDLLFPAHAGVYSLFLAEEQGQGDPDHYFYEVRATVSKEPVAFTVTDPGTNLSATAAAGVVGGDAVLGQVDDPIIAEDWYVIDVPAGKHTLTLDIDAYELGSPADFSIFFYDEALEPLPQGCRQSCGGSSECVECEFAGGEVGWEHDPLAVLESSGNELVYVRVLETENRTGTAYWYLLNVTMEGP